MITLPDSNIRTLAPLSELDYFDSQNATMAKEISPLEAWNLIMEDRQPLLKFAFRIRDAISTRFGVKRIGGFSGPAGDSVKVGDHLDFFLVEYQDDEVIVLTDRDRHLTNMTCIASKDAVLSISSSVSVHNLYGRIYMIPVGLAHKVIVKTMLRRLQRKLDLLRR